MLFPFERLPATDSDRRPRKVSGTKRARESKVARYTATRIVEQSPKEAAILKAALHQVRPRQRISLISKVVIPAAGLGTRLLSATKEMPKEMLPIFACGTKQERCLKPLLQVVFEQLREFGVNEFCFVVGREKRAIVDHFTQDSDFLDKLDSKGKSRQASDLRRFYRAVTTSAISWVNQPKPVGFGHAVLMASSFVGRSHFLVHAGDTYVVSSRLSFLSRLVEAHEQSNADATLLLLRVPPTKGYGFAVVEKVGPTYTVRRVVEKPSRPPSNLAIMPIYVFKPTIMEELRSVRPGVGGEVQLTDGIQGMIEKGYKVQAVKLSGDDVRLDIGTPEYYWEALRLSYRHFSRIQAYGHMRRTSS